MKRMIEVDGHMIEVKGPGQARETVLWGAGVSALSAGFGAFLLWVAANVPPDFDLEGIPFALPAIVLAGVAGLGLVLFGIYFLAVGVPKELGLQRRAREEADRLDAARAAKRD